MAQKADFIVIGAGMAGMSAAAHLSAHGSVIVLEMEEQPGFHTTGRSIATYIENYGSPAVRCLNRASAGFLSAPDPAYWHAPLLSELGLLAFALTGEEKELDHLVSDGVGVERIGVDEALKLMPILRRDRISGAVYDGGVRSIDVSEMLAGYRRRARAAGAEIICRTRVSGLDRTDGCWRVASADGTYEAPVVVNAAGAWVDEVAQLAGLGALGFEPRRRSVATVRVPEAFGATQGWPLCAECKETFYFKPEAGRLLVSPADETPVEPHDAYADDMALAEGLHRFCEATLIEVDRVEGTWGGLRTFSPDGTHVIGFDPRAEGFFWFAGQGGFGIQSAEGAALCAAGLAAEGALPRALRDEGLRPGDIAPDRFLNEPVAASQ